MSTSNQLCCSKMMVLRDKQQVLEDIDLTLDLGQIITLTGRNGAGKTTLLESIAGIIPIQSGSILLNKEKINALPPHQRRKLGIVLVPDRGHVFQKLSVKENIEILSPHPKKTIAELVELFPRFSTKLEQHAAFLSGGEKRILSIFTAISSQPKFLLIDEFSEGLQKNAVNTLLGMLKLASHNGVSSLLVVHSHTFAMDNNLDVIVLDKRRLVCPTG